jgi:hypothetical protein
MHFKNRDICNRHSAESGLLIDGPTGFSKHHCQLPATYFRSTTGLLTLALMFLLFAVSCKMKYSFTGASIPPEVKTIRIGYFPNKALLVNPTLSQEFTDALRNKFQAQTSLILVNNDGDMTIEGEITDYNTRPTAIQSDDVAALNRLTISVKVKFTNIYDEKQNFEQTFTRYEDYPSSADLITVAESLVPIISNYLIEDIFNKSVVNW